jgi:hypothetical protein
MREGQIEEPYLTEETGTLKKMRAHDIQNHSVIITSGA